MVQWSLLSILIESTLASKDMFFKSNDNLAK